MTEDESYYRVPVGEEMTLRGEKREMSLSSHILATLLGVAISFGGVSVGPMFIAYIGLFFTGWAANNAMIAWRCERVDETEADA